MFRIYHMIGQIQCLNGSTLVLKWDIIATLAIIRITGTLLSTLQSGQLYCSVHSSDRPWTRPYTKPIVRAARKRFKPRTQNCQEYDPVSHAYNKNRNQPFLTHFLFLQRRKFDFVYEIIIK